MSNETYLQYKPMIVKIANKYKNNKYDITLDDLVQIGAIGLMNGINSYDSNNCKHSLTTHLYNNIRWEIQKELYKHIKKDKFKIVSIETPIGDDITLADTLEDDIDVFRDVEDALFIDECTEQFKKSLKNELDVKIALDYTFKNISVEDLAELYKIEYEEMQKLVIQYKNRLRRNLKLRKLHVEAIDARIKNINGYSKGADEIALLKINLENKINNLNKKTTTDKIQMLIDRLSS